jgi:hypothetical protein
MTCCKTQGQLQLAIKYAASGYPVFPVNPLTKRPLNRHGHLEATAEPAQIRGWWSLWPEALAAIPTGTRSGTWVLDVDGSSGRASLLALLARLGCEHALDLTGLIGETPRAGLHLYFGLRGCERPRTRAGDIAAGLDTRGLGGCIIAPGNCLPDGRHYRLIGPTRDLKEAPQAPRGLIYLATFNVRERAEIAAEPALRSALCDAEAANWPAIYETHRSAKARRIAARCPLGSANAMRRQALHDLQQAAADYAARRDGRRNGLFSVACLLARYVANSVLSEAELRIGLREAATANGALAAHGPAWFDGTIRRALAYGASDALPSLARRFREAA